MNMQQVIESYTSPADHLALDEALLLAAESKEIGDTIRVWEIDQPTVVVGRSTKVDFEVDRGFCKANQIPILRRCSGGATIVAGSGCLMYSVIISLESNPSLRKIDAAHGHVMSRVLAAVQSQLPDARLQGICDLTWQNRKFSGNSLRIARNCLLYHGTILYAADLPLLVRCLRQAPRQPDYRDQRDHVDFVTNAPIESSLFEAALLKAFNTADEPPARLPDEVITHGRVAELVNTRYGNDDWNFRH